MTKAALLSRASVLPVAIAVAATACQATTAANAAPITGNLVGVITTFPGVGTDTLTGTFSYDFTIPIDDASAVAITVAGPRPDHESYKSGVSTIEAIDGVDSFAPAIDLSEGLANVADPTNYVFLDPGVTASGVPKTHSRLFYSSPSPRLMEPARLAQEALIAGKFVKGSNACCSIQP